MPTRRHSVMYPAHKKDLITTIKICQVLFSPRLNLSFRVYLVLSRCCSVGRGIGFLIFLNNSTNFFIYSALLLSLQIPQIISNPTQETPNTWGTSYPTVAPMSSQHIAASMMGDCPTDLAVGAVIPFA